MHGEATLPAGGVGVAGGAADHTKAKAKEKQLAAGERGKEGGRGNKKETLGQKPAQGFNKEANEKIGEARKEADKTHDQVAALTVSAALPPFGSRHVD